MNKITKAVIPVAGLGTRFLPATKATPKEMLTIIDIPSLEYIVREASESGITDILFVTGRSKKAIEDHFDLNPELEAVLKKAGKEEEIEKLREISSLCNFHYIRQQEPRGLGHAIYHAKTFTKDEPFAVLLGDDVVHNPKNPCVNQMKEIYEDHPGIILGVQEVLPENISKYGALKCSQIADRLYQVFDMVEKPKKEEAPSNIAVLGRYILCPEIYQAIEETKPGSGGEIQLTDAIKKLCGTMDVFGYHFMGRRYDIGDKQGYLEAVVDFALERPDLREGFLKYIKSI